MLSHTCAPVLAQFTGSILLLRELDRQARQHGGAVFMLNGNHEAINVAGNFRRARTQRPPLCGMPAASARVLYPAAGPQCLGLSMGACADMRACRTARIVPATAQYQSSSGTAVQTC